MSKTVVFRSMVTGLISLTLLVFPTQAFAGNTLVLSTEKYTATPHTMLMNAIITEALKRLGYKTVLRRLPSKRALYEANSGEVDGNFLRNSSLSHNYPNLIMVPEPITHISMVAFSKHEDIRVNGWNSLLPLRVVWIRGWQICENKLVNARKISRVNNVDQLFNFLEEDRADVGIFIKELGVETLREMRIKNIHPLLAPIYEYDLFLYLHKKHAKIVPQVAETLHAMKEDGTFQALRDRIQRQQSDH